MDCPGCVRKSERRSIKGPRIVFVDLSSLVTQLPKPPLDGAFAHTPRNCNSATWVFAWLHRRADVTIK